MTPELKFEADSGRVFLGGTTVVISKGMSKAAAEESLQSYKRGHIDHKNGYEWLFFKDLSLGGYPAGMSLGFYQESLTQVHWGIVVPDLKLKDGWPTEESIDREIEILRSLLAKAFGRSFSSGQERFKWGEVWASFDAKGFQASSGLRYAA